MILSRNIARVCPRATVGAILPNALHTADAHLELYLMGIDPAREHDPGGASAHSSTFEHIFHPSDFSKPSAVAYDHALKIALAAETLLSIAHVSPQHSPAGKDSFPCVRDTLTRWQVIPSENYRQQRFATELRVKKVPLTGEDPVEAIMYRLQERPASLIVLANSRQDNRPRWMNKAVSEPILRDSGTRTLFLPHGVQGFIGHETGDVSLRRVLIPVDRQPDPQQAVNTAVELADLLGCRAVTFTRVFVGKESDMPSSDLPNDRRWSWMRTIRNGDVVNEVLDVGRNMAADLIVLTTQGHNGFLDALRGSTTERIVRAAQCPVLAVPAH